MVLIAACDGELLGNVYREGRLKMEVSREFYGGRLTDVEEVVRSIDLADIVNLVGERVVGEAVRSGKVHRDAVIRIAGIPHVQIMKL
ncbi:MAG: DUF424 family protein [Candidatus Bathyarchaeia archaeon]